MIKGNTVWRAQKPVKRERLGKMTTFIVRVELFGNASWQQYENLHSGMERRGFSRTITSDDGTVYDLPSATYQRSSSYSRSNILSEAKAAANAVWNDNAVLVSETNGNTWNGLKKHNNRRSA